LCRPLGSSIDVNLISMGCGGGRRVGCFSLMLGGVCNARKDVSMVS